MLTHDSPPENAMPSDLTQAEPPALTEAEFDNLAVGKPKMSANSIAIAKEVLVFGRSRKAAARDHNLTPQRVGGIVRDFLTILTDVPRGWVKVELWLPADQVETAKALEATARDRLAKSKIKPPPRKPGRPKKATETV